jgi:catechol 2,3-dioxygenase-like lactoylglutathione lyase family enzyme
MKLQTAIVFAKDLAALTRFYRDGLGLAVIAADATDTWVPLDAGGAILGLHAIPAAIAAEIAIAAPPVARADTPIKLVFEVDDLEAARAHLIGHGAVMQAPRWGGCDGCDPEGNVFRIATAS